MKYLIILIYTLNSNADSIYIPKDGWWFPVKECKVLNKKTVWYKPCHSDVKIYINNTVCEKNTQTCEN